MWLISIVTDDPLVSAFDKRQSPMNTKLKSREDRLRRTLSKFGHRLSKTPARSSLRRKHGVGYQVTKGRYIVLGCGSRPFMATLEKAEAFARKFRLRRR